MILISKSRIFYLAESKRKVWSKANTCRTFAILKPLLVNIKRIFSINISSFPICIDILFLFRASIWDEWIEETATFKTIVHSFRQSHFNRVSHAQMSIWSLWVEIWVEEFSEKPAECTQSLSRSSWRNLFIFSSSKARNNHKGIEYFHVLELITNCLSQNVFGEN